MFDREELYKQTLSNIDHLKTVQLANLKEITTLNEVREAQQAIIDRVTQEVFFTIDEYEKRRYPNETIRKIEVKKRLDEIPEYQRLKKEIKTLETKVKLSMVEQENLRNKIKVNREYLRSFGVE